MTDTKLVQQIESETESEKYLFDHYTYIQWFIMKVI